MWEDYDLVTENDLDAIDQEPISLPYRYSPRHYQDPLIDAFFSMLEGESQVKNFIACWHRRAGKDVSFFQLIVAAAISERGDYYYLMPAKNQAKRTIFNGNVMDSSGAPCGFPDFIPPDCLDSLHTQDLEIKFTNGSRIIVGGSDNYDNFVGGNAKGVVYSEWSLTNPKARDLIQPMIEQNKGWELFCFTPRGKNHAYNTLCTAEKEVNSSRWFVSKLTIEDTRDEKGEYVVSPEEVRRKIEHEGLDENIAKQEYYLDFDAAVKGVIYGKQLAKAREEGRVKRIPVDPDTPILTFWDIGISRGNAMAVWLMQPAKNSTDLNCVGYLEAEDEPVNYFLSSPGDNANPATIGIVNEFTEEYGAKLGKVYFPHDGKNREVIAGKKRHEEVIAWGYDVTVLPRTTTVDEGIRQTTKLFPRMNFDEERCTIGLTHLDVYRRKVHKETGLAGSPIHDESSNCADALRQMGQFYADKHVDKRYDKEAQNKRMVTLNRNKNKYNPASMANLSNNNASGGYNPLKINN